MRSNWFVLPPLLALLTVAPALGLKEPSGYGKAEFGMAPDQVREHYPKMEVLEESLGAAMVRGPLVDTYVLREQKLGDFETPVDVELRFWKGRLWVVLIHFDDLDAAKVESYLRDEIELPEDAGFPWKGEEVTLMMNSRGHWFGIYDKEISAEAQKVFLEDLRQKIQKNEYRISVPPSRTPPAAAEPEKAGEDEEKATDDGN